MNRLAALMIALAVAAAPVALEDCQITCAAGAVHAPVVKVSDAHAMHHHGDAAYPSCHHTNRTAPRASSGSRPCDHGETVTALSFVTTRTHTVASAPVRVVASDLSDTVRATLFDRGWIVSAIDRLDFGLCLPLRI